METESPHGSPLTCVIDTLKTRNLPEPALTAIETSLAIPPSVLIRACFAFAIAAVLAPLLTPSISRSMLFNYGARAADAKDGKKKARTQVDGFFGAVTAYGRVPHAWFNHFYVVSVLGSALWGVELFAGGGVVMRFLSEWEVFARAKLAAPMHGMAWEQVVLAWAMLAVQGVRRLYECWFVMRQSKSDMWFVHWLMGLFFYAGIGLAVWIEGAEAILNPPAEASISMALTPKGMIGLTLFAYGWTQQARCHRHLASLKKYTLPQEGLFKHIVCAHYFCECVIYLGLSVAAAPPKMYFNRTLAAALLFVFVNLAATASGTKAWYADKFGSDQVARKWKIMPYLF